MKKLISVVAALAVVGLAQSAFAGSGSCPDGYRLKLIGRVKFGANAIGNLAQGGTVGTGPTITTQSADVKLVIVNCGGTACTAGFANVDTIGSAGAGDYILETGAAANQTSVLDLTDTDGITFSEGISLSDTSGNVNAASVYGCVPR